LQSPGLGAGACIGRANSQKYRIAAVVALFAILSAGTVPLGLGLHSGNLVSTQHLPESALQQSYYPSTRAYKTLPYDEQSGMTFTQNFLSLTFNVTAVVQTGPDGDGPGYLLSGLTDAGFWYQVGLSYNWPNDTGGYLPGFAMNYEVFNSFTGQSIYPSNGGGGIENFTVPVNRDDLVLLSLNFTASGNNVTMSAYDWNNTSSATQSYYACFDFYGCGTYFVGTPSTSLNGYFTGLMTEQYYSTPYTGPGQPVVYSDSDFNYTSATLWIDELNPSTDETVFTAQTNGPVDLYSTPSNTWPAYLSSNGTSIAGNCHEFVTGLQPPSLSAHLSSPLSIHPGDTYVLNFTLQNPERTNGTLTNVELMTDFENYSVNSVNLGPGTTNDSITISIPANATNGNHTVTIQGNLWVYYPQLNAWISEGLVTTSTVLSITGPTTSPTSGLTTILRSLLPWLIAVVEAAAVIVLLVLTINRSRRTPPATGQILAPPLNATCPSCGMAVVSGMMFCPNCGNPLSRTVSQPGSGPNTGPPPPSSS
jgi:hypothetical protein